MGPSLYPEDRISDKEVEALKLMLFSYDNDSVSLAMGIINNINLKDYENYLKIKLLIDEYWRSKHFWILSNDNYVGLIKLKRKIYEQLG